MTVVSIQQPRYLPSMSYFDRIKKSDVHVILDHVTLSKGDFVNRTRIRQRDGRVMWLTIPVSYGQPINETKVHDGPWRRKHAEALMQAYRWISNVPPGNYPLLLVDILAYANLALWTPEGRPRSSKLGGDKLGRKSELILNICKEVGATTYLSGPHGRDYLDLPSFDKAGIEVTYHDFPSDGDWGLSAVHHLFSGETPCSTLPSLSKSADTTKPSGTTTGPSAAATKSTAPSAT